MEEERIATRALPEDRILQEVHATGGDVPRLCDLFGVSVEGAICYLTTIEHPDSNPTTSGIRDAAARRNGCGSPPAAVPEAASHEVVRSTV